MEGPTAGGQTVTVVGTGFYGVMNDTLTLSLGGSYATISNVSGDKTTITASTTSHLVGAVNVVAHSQAGDGTKINGYRYFDAPTVIDVNPGQGSVSGGTDVTITGTNFYGTPDVTFGGNPATNVAVVNSTTITATTPSHAAGTVDVRVTTTSGTGTETGAFRYTCAPGAGQQCIEATITGGISFEAPDDITFPTLNSSSLPQPNYSYGSSGYILNVNDLLSVTDTRGNGGFNVQVQLSSPFETTDHSQYIPLDNFYVATTSSDTGGFRFDPPSNDGIEYDTQPALPCNGSSLDVTPDNRADIPTVLTTPATYSGKNLGTGQNTYIPYDLMDCSLSSGGRNGTFKQNVNYNLSIPAFQPTGEYHVTITFDLLI